MGATLDCKSCVCVTGVSLRPCKSCKMMLPGFKWLSGVYAQGSAQLLLMAACLLCSDSLSQAIIACACA